MEHSLLWLVKIYYIFRAVHAALMFGVIWMRSFIRCIDYPGDYTELARRLNIKPHDGFDKILATYQTRVNVEAMGISLGGAKLLR